MGEVYILLELAISLAIVGGHKMYRSRWNVFFPEKKETTSAKGSRIKFEREREIEATYWSEECCN
jgi:hypothetical protein